MAHAAVCRRIEFSINKVPVNVGMTVAANNAYLPEAPLILFPVTIIAGYSQM